MRKIILFAALALALALIACAGIISNTTGNSSV